MQREYPIQDREELTTPDLNSPMIKCVPSVGYMTRHRLVKGK